MPEKRIIIGTAGHVDHGKTALIKALTGVDADRLPEEKERGITIELGFAPLKISPDLTAGIIDVPGHEKFIKTMIAGAAGIDIALLCIAADEGIKPQTTEHMEICRLLGIKRGIVALTKIDLVAPDAVKKIETDIRGALAGTIFGNSEIVPVSASKNLNITGLKRAIEKEALLASPKRSDGSFRLTIDRVFSVKGFGTVVTGTSLRGKLRTGEKVTIYSGEKDPLNCVVRQLESFGEKVDEVTGGFRVGINLGGIEPKEVEKGDILSMPGRTFRSKSFEAFVEPISGSSSQIKHNGSYRLSIGGVETECAVKNISRGTLSKGDETRGFYAKIITKETIFPEFRERFVLRTFSPPSTVGGGSVLHTLAGIKRESDSAYMDELKVLNFGTIEGVMEAVVSRSGLFGISLSRLAIYLDREFPPEKILDSLNRLKKNGVLLESTDGGTIVTSRHLGMLKDDIKLKVSDFHRAKANEPGIRLETLKQSLSRGASPEIIETAVATLMKENLIERADGIVRLKGKEVVLSAEDKKYHDEIVGSVSDGKLTPPNLKELSDMLRLPMGRTSEIARVAENAGKIVKVKDGLYFSKAAIKDLEGRLIKVINNTGSISVIEFKGLTNTSRKYAIPLLEYFDSERVTLRRPDDRRILGQGKKQR